MSTDRSKVESGTNPPRLQQGLSLVTAPAAVPGSLGCRRRCCGKIKEHVPTVNCSVWQWPRPTDQPVSDSYTLSQQTISVVWSYDRTPRYRVNDAPLSQSRSPTKHLCYVINVCEIEAWFRLRRPQLPTLHICACLCASPAPSPSTAPVHGLLETAAPAGNSGWSSAVLSHTHHTPRQKANNERRMYLHVNSQKLD